MAKKSNYWYVLVMTDNGPVFVTNLNYSDRTAEFVGTDTPKEFADKDYADDMSMGLTLNGHLAFTVHSKFALDSQPYLYSRGKFVWKPKEEDEEDEC